MENTYLIAGLGNPGAEHAGTRHNVGFMAVAQFAECLHAAWKTEERFQVRLARADVEGRKLLLGQPQTFMNSSGTSIRALADYFKVPLSRLLVVVDDADLSLGEIRLRTRGSSGGHHGLESVEEHVGTRSFARLRIGIGRRTDGVREITDYVLGEFQREERKLLETVLERVVRQIECWVTDGIQKAMNEFNGAIAAPPAKES